ncbi:hypothetical protein KSY27_13135 [Bacteroides eggerthii]|nr:hypothetical protein [Bacteroides eggerthii]MBP7130329.1 hypothetical protein [Bacteroides sp.]MBU8974406.1 hypothetical protein [Bacteroides eggerthii]MBV4001012.1 hypothetical protein [Bacteroides eggerthii]
MAMFLQGKRILFFSAHLFGYQNDIRLAMESVGAIVDYYDERPANNFLVKGVIRINRNLLAGYINHYYNKIIKETLQKEYDYVFFIKGESISASNVRRLKQFHPEANFIIYHWDSIANNSNAQNLLPYFDRVFSFDKIDCERLGLHFLPLFYTPDYANIPYYDKEIKYDMLFVGTTHSDRYKLVKRIEEQIIKMGGLCLTWFYFPSKILYYKMKIQNSYLRQIPVHTFHFKPMSKELLLQLYAGSRIIIDVQHPKQTGLTMRCIETLGAKRKLITTNYYITEYDFYNPDNILVVDRNLPYVPEKFLNEPYRDTPKEIYESYSIKNWLSSIFY